jgi:AraC family transcriptional regulator of adaptative response / DNA-3-methyladenine glycosylase II
MFDTEHDPARLAEHFAADDVMLPLVEARPGLRMPNAWDGFELAVRAVLGQQITVIQAAKLAGKMVARYGRRVAQDGPLTHTFPEPAALVDENIAALGMPGARGETIRRVARAALEDPTIFAPGGTVERLRGMRGIGEWTAQYIAMRAMGDRDAFPASDIGLLRAMADQQGRRPTPKALLARAAAWRPFRAYAAQHLWVADAARASRLC